MEQKPIRTPWGESDHREKMADGIWHVTTPSHGGIRVDRVLVNKMPKLLQKLGIDRTMWSFFEEDCAWAAVAVTWPDHFTPDIVETARRLLRNYAKIDCPGPFLANQLA